MNTESKLTKKQPAVILKTDDGEIRFHDLKTWPEFYKSVVEVNIEKRKYLELRLNDRDYQTGDYLLLREYDPEIKEYSGALTWRFVTNIVSNIPHLTDGYIAMSIIDKAPSIKF